MVAMDTETEKIWKKNYQSNQMAYAHTR